MYRRDFWFLSNDRRQVQRLNQRWRRQHVRRLNRSTRREARSLPLRQLDLLRAALHFRGSCRNRNFVIVALRIILNRRAAVFMQLRGRVFHIHRRLRSRRAPVRRRQVHRPGADAHCNAGRLVTGHGIFFHGHQRVGLHRIRRAVRERNPRRAVRPGLYKIAFIQQRLEIRRHPLHRIHFLDLYLAVQVHELRLHLRERQVLGIRRCNCVAHLVIHRGIQIRRNQVHHSEDQPGDDQDVQHHRFVRHCVPIHLYPRCLGRRRRVLRLDGCLYGHELGC